MGNLGLFDEKDHQSLASSQLEGGKINNKYVQIDLVILQLSGHQ